MNSGIEKMYELEFNHDDIQRLQDYFCKAHNMYVICATKDNCEITSFSGTKLEEDFVEQFFPKRERTELLKSFVDGNAENIIERICSTDYFINKGVAIRDASGLFAGAWLCFGIDEEKLTEDTFISNEVKRTTSEAFDKALSLIEVFTNYYISERSKSIELLQKLSLEKDSLRELENRLSKNEIMNDILRMMESEDAFADIAEEIVREAGIYMGVTNVFLLKVSVDSVTVDMITEWSENRDNAFKESSQKMDIKSLPFMNGKPYTISSGAALPADFEAYFTRNDINAGIFLPIEVNDEAGMYICFVSVDRDRKWSVEDLRFANDVKRVINTILNKRITKNSLVSSYSILEVILEKAGCGVAVTDIETRKLLYTNDTFDAMFSNEIDRLAVDEIIFSSDDLLRNISGYSANGTGKWYSINYSDMVWVDGRNVRLTTFFDVSELKTYQKKIEKQAGEDILTSLLNRNRFERDVDAELHFSSKTGKKCAVLLLDINDFSSINEGVGHSKGDSLLKYIARTINGISLIEDKCYRVGGDEFAVIVDHNIYDKLEFIVKRIKSLFENPWNIEGEDYQCSMSMGGVIAPDMAEDCDSLFARLEMALAAAKSKGLNCVEFFDEAIDAENAKRIEWENELKSAVASGCDSFEAYFQPIVSISRDKTICVGAETLCRFNSERYGFLEAGQFIEYAQRLGITPAIGNRMLLEAFAVCKHWNDFGYPDFKVAVNISEYEFLENDIVDTIRDLLNKTAVDPENVILEVREEILYEDLQRAVMLLDSLRALGVKIALDDFGTGFSSLNYIRKLPIDIIKIDNSIIAELGRDSFCQVVVKSVIDMAKALGVKVCCEAVESEAQLDFLKKNSVDFIQGNFVARPLAKEDFETKYLS